MSIRHSDEVIAALYPAAPATREAGFATLLNRLGFLVRVMGQLSLTGASLDQLLACWAPIGTARPGSLYQAMFLTPALLRQDPGAQTATVGPVINVGDVLLTAINGQQVSSYTVQQATRPRGRHRDRAGHQRGDGARPGHRTADEQPVLRVHHGQRDHRQGGLHAHLRSASAGASETYTAAAASPVSADRDRDRHPGARGHTDHDDRRRRVRYAVQAGDTLATIAAGICTAINATSVQDPFAGIPLNGLVVATSNANVVMLSATNAGAPFTLTCNLTPPAQERYTAGPPVPAQQQATITGTVASGDTLVTTINQAGVSYTATAGDTDTATLAAHIAATVSGATSSWTRSPGCRSAASCRPPAPRA